MASVLGESDGKGKDKTASMMRLLALAKPEYHLLIGGMVFLMFSSGSAIAAPLFFGRVIDAANPIHHDKEGLNRAILTLGTCTPLSHRSFFHTTFPFI